MLDCGLLHGSATLELLELVEHIVTVVARLAHSFVEIVQSRVRHLEGLIGDSGDASQVCLIALVLEDSFFTQLNPVLLLQLLN